MALLWSLAISSTRQSLLWSSRWVGQDFVDLYCGQALPAQPCLLPFYFSQVLLCSCSVLPTASCRMWLGNFNSHYPTVESFLCLHKAPKLFLNHLATGLVTNMYMRWQRQISKMVVLLASTNEMETHSVPQIMLNWQAYFSLILLLSCCLCKRL